MGNEKVKKFFEKGFEISIRAFFVLVQVSVTMVTLTASIAILVILYQMYPNIFTEYFASPMLSIIKVMFQFMKLSLIAGLVFSIALISVHLMELMQKFELKRKKVKK